MLNPLTDTALKEYRKTAALVQRSPWDLVVASAYLNKLCDESEACRVPEPPELSFVFEYSMPALGLADAPVPNLILDGTEGVVVRPISVGPAPKDPKPKTAPKPKAALKRPAHTILRRPAKRASTEMAPLEDAAADTPAPGAAGPPVAPDPRPGMVVVVGSEGFVACGPEAVAAPEVPPAPPAPPPCLPEGWRYGCSKCRDLKKGCLQCRVWAASGKRGYIKTHDGHIMAPLQRADDPQ